MYVDAHFVLQDWKHKTILYKTSFSSCTCVSYCRIAYILSINPTIDFLLHNFVDHSENDDSMASNNEAQLKCTLLNV